MAFSCTPLCGTGGWSELLEQVLPSALHPWGDSEGTEQWGSQTVAMPTPATPVRIRMALPPLCRREEGETQGRALTSLGTNASTAGLAEASSSTLGELVGT